MNKKIVISYIVLVVIILLLGGFIYLDKFVLGKDEHTLTVIDDVSIDLSSFIQVSETLEKFDNAFNDANSTYFGYFYNQKKLLASKMDSNVALYVAAYGELERTNSPKVLPSGIVQSSFEKIFGKQLKYNPQNIEGGNFYNIPYSAETDSYTYTAQPIQKTYAPGYMAKNTKVTVGEEEIVVMRKIFYVEYIPNASGVITKASIYKDATKNNKLAELALHNGTLRLSEVIDKYGSKLLTYQYTFKQRSVDDYSFYLLERK